MKKRTLRILSLILAMIMITSALVACDNGSENHREEPTQTSASSTFDTQSETETEVKEYMPDVEQNDYGETFKLEGR